MISSQSAASDASRVHTVHTKAHARSRTAHHQIDRTQVISDRPVIAGQKRKRPHSAPASVSVDSAPALISQELVKEMEMLFERVMSGATVTENADTVDSDQDSEPTPLKRQKRIKTRRQVQESRIQARQIKKQEEINRMLQKEFTESFALPVVRKNMSPVENLVTPQRRRSSPLFEFHTSFESSLQRKSLVDVVGKYLGVMTNAKKSKANNSEEAYSPVELIVQTAPPHIVSKITKMSSQKLEPASKRSMEQQLLISQVLCAALKAQNKSEKEIQAVIRRASKAGTKKARKNPLRSAQQVQHMPQKPIIRTSVQKEDEEDDGYIERRKPKSRK